MLKDIVVQGLVDFKSDCHQLCQNFYPTVHNRGMSDHHLGLAFARRMSSKFTEYGHESYFESLDWHPTPAQPFHFRVSSDIGTVWVHSHHLISANRGCRKNILDHVRQWQQEYGFAIQPNDLLVIIGDHWFSRNKSSRELFSWWNGHLPDALEIYKQQGVILQPSESSLHADLDNMFNIRPCYVRYSHPIPKPNDDGLVKKYIQLYSIVEWQH
ncbi:hypothetical protein [Vibrio sp. SCSIO 43136]|uniref:hypothetical protein n=1 Tax=Vibrio sp. SCSIO 43136 TaxID=2819101 RepID=UPI0020756568|nr:hypothetical protein [Vibrio sp. SCSIO 43136]USD66756.1 hypothetical protein J4N39_19055 [Vibrio sp. SCSIO 43136]